MDDQPVKLMNNILVTERSSQYSSDAAQRYPGVCKNYQEKIGINILLQLMELLRMQVKEWTKQRKTEQTDWKKTDKIKDAADY